MVAPVELGQFELSRNIHLQSPAFRGIKYPEVPAAARSRALFFALFVRYCLFVCGYILQMEVRSCSSEPHGIGPALHLVLLSSVPALAPEVAPSIAQ